LVVREHKIVAVSGRPRRRWTDDIKQWTGIPVADCVQRARDRSVWTVEILGVRVGDLRSSDMRKDLWARQGKVRETSI